MTKSGTQNGTRDKGLGAFVGLRVTIETDRAMRLISALRNIRLSDAYRQAACDYIAGAVSELESAPGAGLAGQGDAELAAALRAALA